MTDQKATSEEIIFGANFKIVIETDNLNKLTIVKSLELFGIVFGYFEKYFENARYYRNCYLINNLNTFGKIIAYLNQLIEGQKEQRIDKIVLSPQFAGELILFGNIDSQNLINGTESKKTIEINPGLSLLTKNIRVVIDQNAADNFLFFDKKNKKISLNVTGFF